MSATGFVLTLVGAIQICVLRGFWVDVLWTSVTLSAALLGLAAVHELRDALRAAQRRETAALVHAQRLDVLRAELLAQLARCRVEVDLDELEELLAAVVARIEAVA